MISFAPRQACIPTSFDPDSLIPVNDLDGGLVAHEEVGSCIAGGNHVVNLLFLCLNSMIHSNGGVDTLQALANSKITSRAVLRRDL